MEHIKDDNVRAYFATLDLEASDAISLFHMLDDNNHDDCGIDVEDFVNGCLRLKGPAKSYDTARLMAECKAILRQTQMANRALDMQSQVLFGGGMLPSCAGGCAMNSKGILRETKIS